MPTIGIDDESAVNRPRPYQGRNWCFTINSYTDEDIAKLSKIECIYICYQPEIGESGNKHLQGFITFKNARAMLGIRKLFQRLDGTFCAHLESMRGTVDQAVAYCKKEETRDGGAAFGFTERGLCPMSSHQGSRTDLSELVSAIKTGKRGREVFEVHGESFLRYHKGIHIASGFYEQPRSVKTIVKWYYGPTGTGKSRAARNEAPDSYWKNPSDFWWDGYDRQQTVIIDDYRPDFCKFSTLLRLFDEYPLRVQNKGGSIEFKPLVIIVTAPKSPDDIWHARSDEDLNQLLRRIEVIKFFKEKDICEIIKS